MPFKPFQQTSTNGRPNPTKFSTQHIALTAETYSANQRLAQALADTSDFSGIIPILLDTLKAGGASAQAEITDLIQQMEARLPGHGQKLARELQKNGAILQSASILHEPAHLAGGPDGAGGPVHVDAYNQSRDGTSTHVSSHTRSAPLAAALVMGVISGQVGSIHPMATIISRVTAR